MALRIDNTIDRPMTKLGEVIEQIHDHRLPATGDSELRFCEQSIWTERPEPEPDVVWAD